MAAMWDCKTLRDDLTYIKTAAAVSARRGFPEALQVVTIAASGGMGSLIYLGYDAQLSTHSQADGDLAAVQVNLVDLITALKSVGVGGATIARDDEGNVTVEGCEGSATVAAYISDDSIRVAELSDAKVEMTVDGQQFATAAAAAAVAVSNDDTLPMLCGIRLEANEGDRTADLVATDRFRLVSSEIAVEQPVSARVEALIPAKALTAFTKRTAKREGQVLVEVFDSHVRLTDLTDQITIHLTDCEFPKWRQLLPEAGAERLRTRIDGQDMARRLRKVKPLSPTIKIEVDGDAMEVVTYGGDEKKPAARFRAPIEHIDDASTSGPVVAGYTCDYLLSMLGKAPKGQIDIHWQPESAGRRPLAIEWPGVRSILMPVRLESVA